MIERRLVDTSLIIRYLVREQEKQAAAADKLFEACEAGEIKLVLLPEVLAECVFVLQSFYNRARAEIAGAMSIVVSNPGLEITDRRIHLDAIGRYRDSTLHFVDCTLAAYSAAGNIALATFDTGFKKFSDLRVQI